MQHDYGPWLNHFSDALTPGQTALDIGCGSGDDTLALVEAGLRVTALDLKPANIRCAASRTTDATFLVADLRAGLPFRDNLFNLAVASLSLHYFDRATTARILHDIQRVTTPGATLLARVNVVGDTASLWGTGTEHEPDYFEVQPGLFKRFFTESSLRQALAPHFDIHRIFPMATVVHGHHPKQTLVVRATRRDG
ncbi:MAG: class I SAM-dependent methyltransferase [Thermomicrobiales bacterium]